MFVFKPQGALADDAISELAESAEIEGLWRGEIGVDEDAPIPIAY